jgi:hypothetical protein
MNTRCKPGDLAIIISDVPGCEENIGRFVHVRGPAAIDYKGQLTWLIMPVDTTEPYVIDNYRDGSFRYMHYLESIIEHPDAWMLPIRPEQHLEEDHVKEIEGIEA